MARSRIDVVMKVAAAAALLATAQVDSYSLNVAIKAIRFTPSGSIQIRRHQSAKRRSETTPLPHATSSSQLLSHNNHRHSSSDWLYNIQSIPCSTILREVKHPVIAVFAWSTIVTVLHKALLGATSSPMRAFAASMQLPGTAHSFLVSALGLLLVFRTNSAYQRFQVRRTASSVHVDFFSLIGCLTTCVHRLGCRRGVKSGKRS
jgi:hypothetical protein